MTQPAAQDPSPTVDQLLRKAYQLAAAGAMDLSRRGITPTLGLYTVNEDEQDAEFLDCLDHYAAVAGVLIKHIDSRVGTRERPSGTALAELPDSWDIDTSWLAAAAHELSEFHRRHRAASEPGEQSLSLANWMTWQRVAHVRDGVRLLVEDPTVHGVICPPPLPRGLTPHDHIAQLVPEDKDVDGVHPGTLRRLLPGIGFPDDVVLTAAACDETSGWQVRRIASAMLVVATVAAAQRQHPRSLPHSGN